MQISNHALNVLHHTLGLRPDCRRSHRNHFLAGKDHHEMPAIEELDSWLESARSILHFDELCQPG